ANRASADAVPILLTATTNGTSAPTVSMRERTPNAGGPAEPRSEIRDPRSEIRFLACCLTLVKRLRALNSKPRIGFRISSFGFLRGRLAAACIIGLVAALLLRGSVDRMRKPTAHDAGRASSSTGGASASSDFAVEGIAERFPTLAAAVASAP